MPEDKNLFHYGGLYHRLLDPLIRPARTAIVEQIPHAASVLDLGCGTGLLSLELASARGCHVLGLDLSSRMIAFARTASRHELVEFQHGDATDLTRFKVGEFDYAVILNLIHELWPDEQDRMLAETLRVSRNLILFDSVVPLPWNIPGVIKRVIEVSFGTDHYPQFKTYLESGGIKGILDRNGLSARVSGRSLHAAGTNQLVQIGPHYTSPPPSA